MVFDRIVCGVDGSPMSLAALDHALRLLEPGGRLVTVTARHLARALLRLDGASGAASVSDEAVRAHAVARAAAAHLPGAEARLVDGDPSACLLAVAEHERARLLVIGARPHGRSEGVLLGRVDTVLLHRAPCPVLVARAAWNGGAPGTIAVGVDGSAPSLLALALAQRLGRRFGARVAPVAADGALPVASARSDPRRAVPALLAASEEADLLVVGSRGLQGPAALGSVSERVAHGATCSVLVVRPLAEDVRAPAPAAA